MAGATVAKQVIVEMRAIDAGVTAHIQQVTDAARKGKKEVDTHSGAVDRMSTRYSIAGRQIAGAAEMMARSGKITGEAAKSMISQASNIAFAFGAGGAAVGALGIFGIAAATWFGRAKREAREAREEFEKTLRVINVDRDYRAAGNIVQQLLAGDPTAEDPFEQMGILKLRDSIRQKREGQERRALPGGGFEIIDSRANTMAIQEEEAALAKLEARYKAITPTWELAAERERERLENLAGMTAEERASAEAVRERTQALKEQTQQIVDLYEQSATLGRQVAQLALESTGSAAEQGAARFNAKIAQASALLAKGIEPAFQRERIATLTALRDSFVEVTGSISDAEKMLASLESASRLGVEPVVDDFLNLNSHIEWLRFLLSKLPEDAEGIRKAEEAIAKLEKERAGRLKDVANANVIGGGGPDGKARSTADLARDIQQATDGALQLAMAFGAVDDEVGNVLRAIGQIAGNIPALSTAIKSGGTLGIIGAALPILGALGSLIGDSPEQQQRREELRRNTDAIRELTKKAGFLGIGISGTAASGAASGLAGFLGSTPNVPFFDARKAAREFGLDLAELDEIAKAHGVTLNGNIKSFHQLSEALGLTITKLGEFGDDLASQQAQAEAEIDIFGITDPAEQERIRRQALAGRSPILDQALAGLDLSTPEGRAKARENLQAIFSTMQLGDDALTDGELGTLDGDELLAAIQQIIDGFDAIDNAAGLNTSTVGDVDRVITADRTQITADQASRMLGVQTSQLTELRIIRAALTASQTPLTLPSLPPGFASIAPMGGGGTTINITQNIEIMGGVSDVPTLARGLAADLVDEIDRALGRKARIRRAHLGAGTREA